MNDRGAWRRVHRADEPQQVRKSSIEASRSMLRLSIPGGDSGARTRSLRLAKPALSQLSYIPDDRFR